MKKNIPNYITCMNIICGALSMVMSLHFGFLKLAALFIIFAAIFDFFDGFTARLLKVQSPLGVDLDSLADVFSFGGAPAMIVCMAGTVFTELAAKFCHQSLGASTPLSGILDTRLFRIPFGQVQSR